MPTGKVILCTILSIGIVFFSYKAVVMSLHEIHYNSNPNPQAFLAFPVFLLMAPYFIQLAWQDILGVDLERLAISTISRLTGCDSEIGEGIVWSMILFVCPAIFYLVCRRAAVRTHSGSGHDTSTEA